MEMKREDNWHIRHCKAIDQLTKIGYRLESLSNSFYGTGNTIMGDELLFIAQNILDTSDILGNAVGESIHERFKQSQETSTTILKATLAGCLIGAKDKA